MKTLSIKSVKSIYDRTLKNGSTRTQLAVELQDGNVTHINKDYLEKKLQLVGVTFNEFLSATEDFVLDVDSDATVTLREEGVEFSYTDANGVEQKNTPKSTYWEIRGSFGIKMTEKAKLLAKASASVADKMMASFGLNLDAIAEKAVATEEVIETEPEIVD